MVDGNGQRHAVLAGIANMTAQILQAALHRVDIVCVQLGAGYTAVHFQRAHGGHHHHRIRTKPDFLHLILKNFSAPRSAPNPASVTT